MPRTRVLSVRRGCQLLATAQAGAGGWSHMRKGVGGRAGSQKINSCALSGEGRQPTRD
jgi:hypothetical protein